MIVMCEEGKIYKRLYEEALSELRIQRDVSESLSNEYTSLARESEYLESEYTAMSGVYKRYGERINDSIEKLNKLKEQYER